MQKFNLFLIFILIPKINIMKKVFTITLLSFLTVFTYAQTVYNATFKPGPNIGQDAVVFKTDNQCIPSNYNTAPEFLNFGNTTDITYFTWSFFDKGCPNGIGRSLLKFEELNSIPANAIIINAELRLYGVDTAEFMDKGNNHYPNSPYPLSNPGEIYKIQPGANNFWDEQTVTWNTAQNLTLDPNFVNLPITTSKWNWNHTISGTDFVNMIQSMLGANNNNGFLFKLETEIKYRSVNFASSNHSDSTKWPELYIEYTLPCDASFNYSVDINNPYNYTFEANDLNNTYYAWIVNGNTVGNNPTLTYSFPGPGDYEICLHVGNDYDKCERCFKLCINENREHYVLKNQEEKDYSQSSIPISGDNLENTTTYNIFPNPTNDGWNIEFHALEDDKGFIEIFDIQGKLILNKKLNIKKGKNNIHLNDPKLNTGNYYFNINSKSINIQDKIIKIK